MGGSKEVNQIGIYGTKGIEDENNTPGGRHYSMGWKNSYSNNNNNLIWVFRWFRLF